MKTKTNQYIKHIKRLQHQNKILTECLIEERHKRQQAYNWYQNRLNSKFFWILDLITQPTKK